ncbi:MAG: hypothetical protein Q9191_002482 [Dirinaria sp. TL-2023a]
MADSTIDPAQLSESQQLALGTYTSVTNQEPSAAIPLLRRSEWNIQIAIAKFFDGEAPDPLQEARASLEAPNPPTQRSHRETVQNGFASRRRLARSSAREPAPRIVPQPENQTVYRSPLVLSILFTPFSLLYRLVSGSVSFIGRFFPFLPRLLSGLLNRSPQSRSRQNIAGRRPLNPRDNAIRFAREFEEEYGSHNLRFYQDGYAQAYDLAKKDLKFLLVVLISPEHDETSSFVRETLLSQEVVGYIDDPRNNIILWGGTVQDSEAYQVSAALNCTKFPFAALISHTPQDSTTSMSTIARISGPLPPSAFAARLRTAISRQSSALERVRSTRNEQQAARNLREEQNTAYERSLAQDRERARQRREAEAARLRAETEEKVKLEAAEQEHRNLEQWRRWRAQSIPPEPAAHVAGASRVSIRMPSGERVIRKFEASTSMEELYAFVECHGSEPSEKTTASNPANYEHCYKFRLVSPIPRQVYSTDGGTIGSILGRSGNLIVEPIDEDEDE